jgi:Fur family ferric uptake transcriptional regulator
MGEDLLEDLESRVSSEFGFEILNHQLKIFGHCKNCRK